MLFCIFLRFFRGAPPGGDPKGSHPAGCLPCLLLSVLLRLRLFVLRPAPRGGDPQGSHPAVSRLVLPLLLRRGVPISRVANSSLNFFWPSFALLCRVASSALPASSLHLCRLLLSRARSARALTRGLVRCRLSRACVRGRERGGASAGARTVSLGSSLATSWLCSTGRLSVSTRPSAGAPLCTRRPRQPSGLSYGASRPAS